jgi:cell division ATPase FtsA
MSINPSYPEGILALDIGGSQIAGVVGSVGVSGQLEILSTGSNNHPTGFRKGQIIDFEQAVTDMKQTIARVCYASSASIHYLLLNLAHARHLPVELSRQGLLLPSTLTSDAFEPLRPFQALAERFNIELLGFIPDALAVSQVILKQREKEEGVLLLDCGWDMIHGALYEKGHCQTVFEVPIGGRHLTNDLAYGLKISPREAESIKIKYSTDAEPMAAEFPVEFISEILEARLGEMFALILDKVKPFATAYSLVIMTGGTSKTKGMAEIALKILGQPVLFRYYPVSECPVVIGAPWEMVPVGMLCTAMENETIRRRLGLIANEPSVDSVGGSSIEPLAATSETLIYSSVSEDESETIAVPAKEKVLSPVKMKKQTKVPGQKRTFFQDVKAVLEEFF